MPKEITSQLQLQALYDLTMRAKAGIVVYFAVWTVFVAAFDFWELSQNFVIINFAIIVLSMVTRLVHMQKVKRASEENAESLYQFLIINVLLSALHWGVLTAWVLYLDKSTSAAHLMLIVLPAFAMGGASTLSISSGLRILYPIALYAPPLAIFFYQSDPLSLVYAISILISYFYVVSASRYSRENYWSSIRNHLIAEERAAELEKLSTTDQLTQLKNRMYFDEEYDTEWRRSLRLKAPLSIIMIDFDHFKQLNDTYGHLFGDEVLKQASPIISNELKRPTDCIARYGGEEFVAMLPNTDREGAQTTGERIGKAVEKLHIEHQGRRVPITCSVGGCTIVPDHNLDKTDLIKFADGALYQAKGQGRNRYFAAEFEF